MKQIRTLLFTFSLIFLISGLAYAAPQAPVLTTAVDNLDATLSWPQVEGATGYSGCYAPYPEGTPIICQDVGDVTEAGATLAPGDSYYVALMAYDADGNSGYSNVEVVMIAGPAATPAERALEHMAYISENIGIRTAGSWEERVTRDYIVNELQNAGLTVETQKFTFESDDVFGESYNVIAVVPGASTEQVIVGAHYDSVDVGEGYSDNASGVGALLAAAETLAGRTPPPYTTTFIAFGAEEVGLFGSEYYASQMTAQEIADTIGMINLDTLVGGDIVYVYGGAGDAGWIRDQALAIADPMALPLETNPGLNPDYPEGTTGDWSDHAPFRMQGIPYAYFESTNWEIGDLDGYVQTVDHGEIWHTENDTATFFGAEYPGRVEAQMTTVVDTVNDLLMNIDPPATEEPAARKTGKAVRFTTRDGKAF